MKIGLIIDVVIDKFFPVIVISCMIAVAPVSRFTGEKPEVLIAVLGFLAATFSIRRYYSKIGLELIYNDRKMPDWVFLPIAAVKGILIIVLISFFLSLFFPITIGVQLMIIAPLVALIENRKISRQKILVVFAEMIFQVVLIIQVIASVFIVEKSIVVAIFAIPLTFLLSFWIYRIERKIEKEIKEQNNARQDQS